MFASMQEPLVASTVASTLAIVGGTLTYAALSAQSQLFGKVLIAPRNPNEIALTYDDGPNDIVTERLLDLLAHHNIRATFFLIGNSARQRPQIVRAIAASGHLIGNHSMTHPWLAWQSPARIREELADCKAILEDTLGDPIRYFRAPHGARRPAALPRPRRPPRRGERDAPPSSTSLANSDLHQSSGTSSPATGSLSAPKR